LARRPVADELEAPEAAEPAHLADRRMLLRELAEQRLEHRSELGGVFDDSLLPKRLDRSDADGAGERMAAVREPAGEAAASDPVRERLTDRHRAERDVAGVDALRHREDVGDHVPVL